MATKLTPKSMTPEFLADAGEVINSVWQYIGSDVLACCAEMGERCSNEAAVEACIDADRPTMLYNQDKARAERFMTELRRLIKAHGYPPVLRSLARRFPLV